MHYVIIILIVAAIVILQVIMFVSTLKKVKIFRLIFPESVSFFKRKEDSINEINNLSDEDLQVHLRQENQKVEKFTKVVKVSSALFSSSTDYYRPKETQEVFDRNKAITFLKSSVNGEISSSHDNKILSTIISAINDYLSSNKNAVNDFHLMKDIVDRNCDAQEEEINTQIPIPLYLGLVGTMVGILVGIGYLWIFGGLDALLSSPKQGNLSNEAFNVLKETLSKKSVNGITALLGGVALAMFASFAGIVLTTIGSYLAKSAKSTVENNKHKFLTWIQAKLLPNLSTDTSGALVKMSQNLRAFNETFSKNTGDLGKTLAKVNESYSLQKQLWDSVKEFADKDISQVNLELLTTMKLSIVEIGKLSVYLQSINQYQTNITDAIEKMQKFFALGIEQIDNINIGVKNALERFSQNTNTYLETLQEKLDGQILNVISATKSQQEAFQKLFDDFHRTLTDALKLQNDELLNHFTAVSSQMKTTASEQQKMFSDKLEETTALVEELKNLTHIKEGIKDFKEATNKQNQKIDELAKEIRALAKAKIEGGTIKQEITLPKWIKILIITGSSLFAVACLFFIIPLLIEWITNLINWIF